MITFRDVEPGALIDMAAQELKKQKIVTPPEWSTYVKTGSHVERTPEDRDWWYIRSASVLRRTYIQPVGVSRLKTVYGGRKNRGFKPERRRDAGGKILRVIFQQLGEAGLVKKSKKGRVITPKGQKFLDSVAFIVAKAKK